MNVRERIARRLRYTADRLDRNHAPKAMSFFFTFEEGEGIKFRDDGRGCRLWYLSEEDYDRAFSEADSEPPRVHWDTMTVTHPVKP